MRFTLCAEVYPHLFVFMAKAALPPQKGQAAPGPERRPALAVAGLKGEEPIREPAVGELLMKPKVLYAYDDVLHTHTVSRMNTNKYGLLCSKSENLYLQKKGRFVTARFAAHQSFEGKSWLTSSGIYHCCVYSCG